MGTAAAALGIAPLALGLFLPASFLVPIAAVLLVVGRVAYGSIDGELRRRLLVTFVAIGVGVIALAFLRRLGA
ncbi:MAG: hypothetical protein ABR529_07815 [Actinomycetota bacterium]